MYLQSLVLLASLFCTARCVLVLEAAFFHSVVWSLRSSWHERTGPLSISFSRWRYQSHLHIAVSHAGFMIYVKDRENMAMNKVSNVILILFVAKAIIVPFTNLVAVWNRPLDRPSIRRSDHHLSNIYLFNPSHWRDEMWKLYSTSAQVRETSLSWCICGPER